MKVPDQIQLERDAMMWELKKRGLTYEQIGKALNVSTKTAQRGVQRMGKKLTERLAADHSHEVALESARLDAMILAIEDQATGRKKVTTPDGEEVTLPPSFEAQDRMMKLIGMKIKLLGLDQTRIDVTVSGGNGAPMLGVGEQAKELTSSTDSKTEALGLLKIMSKAGVFPEDVVKEILMRSGEVVDAEVIEDTEEQMALPAAPLELNEPPEWVEEDDSEVWD